MVYQEYQVSYMSSNNDWKLPLNLAIGFHIMVALTAVYLPLLFESKPKFTDIYTVNLVNMSEPAAAPAARSSPGSSHSLPPKAPPKMIEKTAAPVKIPPKDANRADSRGETGGSCTACPAQGHLPQAGQEKGQEQGGPAGRYGQAGAGEAGKGD